MERIYLDHGATTGVAKEVLEKMMPYFSEVFGNGSSQHFFGREALEAIDNARESIAKNLNCRSTEIYFVSGGSEADNMAIKGYALAHKDKGNHIITSKIEHPAVLETCRKLEKYGFEVTYLDVDKEGFVSPKDFEAAIKDTTILASIMMVNNEIGAIEPIKELAAIAKAHGVVFHTDAVQAVGNIPVDVKDLGVDMLSLSAHKFYGPKGVGVLYKKNGVKIQRFLDGGEQERNLRASTLNTPGIVGCAAALDLAIAHMEENNKKTQEVRDYFVKRVQELIPNIYYNGPKDPSKRIPGNSDFSFIGIEGEGILFHLDLHGIAVSSGSACSSGSLDPSHVLLAIGIPMAVAHGSIRFSFGKENTIEQAEYTVKVLEQTVKQLRAMSPIYEELLEELKKNV